MKKTIIALLFLTSTLFSVRAQQGGIRFEDDLSWQQVLEKAKDANKYIFVDCYTTWCGPCKYMADSVFSLAVVGGHFDNNFVSIRVQMDVTAHDPDRVKSWYAAAEMLAKKYDIEAYPTYLIFAPDGHAVHRLVGVIKDPQEFVGKADDAFNPERQYYTLIGDYKNHLTDSAFLHKALTLALGIGDQGSANAIADAYVDCVKAPFAKTNLALLSTAVNSPTGSAFHLFLDHPGRVDAVLGKETAEGVTINTVYRNEIDPLFAQAAPIDWAVLRKKFLRLYPGVADRVLGIAKIKYYKEHTDIGRFNAAMRSYMDKYAGILGMYELNDRAWDVFLLSHDRALLLKAVTWSHRAIADYPNVDWEYLDTYSNLLYKTGNRTEAMVWERKAIAMAKIPIQKQEFEKSLRKMEEGKKTWD